jgi:hypothetical protein
MSLKKASSQSQYISDCLQIVKNVNSMDTGALQNVLIQAVNKQLVLAGVPEVTKHTDGTSGANAVFDFQNWRITFGAPLMVPSSMATLILGVNTVYHEARHCEQWFRMAQGVAAGKLNKEVRQRIDNTDPTDIAGKLWIPVNIIQTAILNTDYGSNTDQEVEKWWNSIYASSGGIRGRKLAHINERYDAYRHLPEEVDAWALGDGVEEQFIQSCPKLGCPKYKNWKSETYWFAHRRSSELKAVDKALEKYEKSKSLNDRKDLKVKFDAWYKLKEDKGGSKRVSGTDNVVEQLKTFLDQYNASGIPKGGIKVM